jgi:hypothetical protein
MPARQLLGLMAVRKRFSCGWPDEINHIGKYRLTLER